MELKSVKRIILAHEIQLVNYLVATGKSVGLLLNFGEQKVEVKRKVKELTKEIKTLQEDCLHTNTEWINTPVYKPSLVPGYFIILNEETHFVMSFSMRCKDCSFEQEYYAKKTCPICLQDMKDDGWMFQGSIGSRVSHMGKEHIYFSLRRFICSNSHCSFKGVADEWNR